MAIKKPAPKKLSVEAQQAITQASATQTGQAVRVKSYDPDYPVFDIPINQKLLVYIPNHTVMNADGTVGLRMDKFAAHPILDGRSYGDIRCSQGIVVDELGLDGTCPLCDGISENWELYNKEYADIAKTKGIDPQSPEAQDLLKQDRIDLVHKMTIKQADVWYTFPIVVIECEEKDGVLTTTPKRNADGQITGKAMWYSIRERTFTDKWVAGYDSIATEDGSTPTSPAGQWAILNFTYTPKSGNCDKMGSARALKVTFKTMGDAYNSWATHFDQMTQDWTPEKAQEVVVLDAIRDMAEMREVADTLLKPVREKLAMYSLGAVASGSGEAPAGLPNTDADTALAGFGALPTEDNLTGEVPNAGV
jgi:hypothetical protein